MRIPDVAMITDSGKHHYLSPIISTCSSSCIPSSLAPVEIDASGTIPLAPYGSDLGSDDLGFGKPGLQEILNDLPDLDDSYFDVTTLETLMASLP